jgi:sterol desaturase/sphingolipid hydroxylase (fatty acid hydroxylase superfamily)
MGTWGYTYLSLLAWMFALTAGFYLLEWLRPTANRPTWRERAENCAYLVLVLPLILWVQPFFNPAFDYAINVTGGGLIRRILPLPQNFWTTVLLTLVYALIWDVWHYWIHRWQHMSPLLWETHKFHHSDTAVNATTQGRHHLLSHLLNLVLAVPMLLVLGTLSPPALIGLLMFRVWGFVNHANLRVSFGPFTSIIAGPQWHRIHHSTELQHRSKNYATFFPFVDKLFGTYYAPAADEYPPTGLGEAVPEPFLRQAVHSPLAVWYERARCLVRGGAKTLSG